MAAKCNCNPHSGESLVQPSFLPFLREWCPDLFPTSQDFGLQLLPLAWSTLGNGCVFPRSTGGLLLPGGLAWI